MDSQPPKTGTVLKSSDASLSKEKLQSGCSLGVQQVTPTNSSNASPGAVAVEETNAPGNSMSIQNVARNDVKYANDLIFETIGRSNDNQQRQQKLCQIKSKLDKLESSTVSKIPQASEKLTNTVELAEAGSALLEKGKKELQQFMATWKTTVPDSSLDINEVSDQQEEEDFQEEFDSDSTVPNETQTRPQRVRKIGKYVCQACNMELWGRDEAKNHRKLCAYQNPTVVNVTFPEESLSPASPGSDLSTQEDDKITAMDVAKEPQQ